jgi:Tol biopolymer transport system component
MRVALASVAALVAVGCGSTHEESASPPSASDGGAIVFTGVSGGGGGYYAMRPDGTQVRKLGFGHEDVTLSADGRFIAAVAKSFERDEAPPWGDDRVFVSRMDGSERRRVSVPDQMTLVASVSPGGDRVALVYGPDPFNGPWDVWTVSANGEDFEQKTSTGHVESVTWSLDGKHLSFVDEQPDEEGGYDGNGDVYVMRSDGSDLRRVAQGAEPAWSPDGERVAFTDADWNVSVVDRNGGELQLIVRDARQPTWSPDGKRLAFLRNVACGHATCTQAVFVVSAQGGKATRAGPTLFEPTLLAWTTAELPVVAKSSRQLSGLPRRDPLAVGGRYPAGTEAARKTRHFCRQCPPKVDTPKDGGRRARYAH